MCETERRKLAEEKKGNKPSKLHYVLMFKAHVKRFTKLGFNSKLVLVKQYQAQSSILKSFNT